MNNQTGANNHKEETLEENLQEESQTSEPVTDTEQDSQQQANQEFVEVPPNDIEIPPSGEMYIPPHDMAAINLEEYEQVVRERDELKDQFLRLQADFINYRKRLARERDEDRERLTQDLIARLLDVVDNMERALTAQSGEESVEMYRTGVQMIQQQLMSVLGDYGVTRISASKGLPFDPHYHEAVSQIESDEVTEGAILVELTPGYQIRDRILRASRVQVAVSPSESGG